MGLTKSYGMTENNCMHRNLEDRLSLTYFLNKKLIKEKGAET